MSARSAFAEQRQALEAALVQYDSLTKDGTDASTLTVAEHQIYLASKALTTQLTPPGVFVLNQVFQVGARLCNHKTGLKIDKGHDSLRYGHGGPAEDLRHRGAGDDSGGTSCEDRRRRAATMWASQTSLLCLDY